MYEKPKIRYKHIERNVRAKLIIEESDCLKLPKLNNSQFSFLDSGSENTTTSFIYGFK